MPLPRTSCLAGLLVVASLALTSCVGLDRGAGDGAVSRAATASTLVGSLAGAGSSAQSSAMVAWIADFQRANPDVTISYDPSGSGAGRQQFIAGGLDFAGSDVALDERELAAADVRCGEGGVVEVPLYLSPIAVAFNLPGVASLNLRPSTIARIFAQQISDWDAPEIARDNPGVDLPSIAITPISRSDRSGTTQNFTEYLATVVPDVWRSPPDGDWPIAGGSAGQGTAGVIQAVTATEGAITYADASQVADLGTVAVGVGAGYVSYTPEAAAKILELSPRAVGRPDGSLAIALDRDTTATGSYPLVLVSYQLACTTYDDEGPDKTRLVAGFLQYLASEQGQAAAAAAAGSAPISAQLRTDALAVIDTIGA